MVELATGRHDVRAGLEQPADDVDVGPVAHVEDAVGAQRQDLVDVSRGDDAGRRRVRTARRRRVPTLSSEYTYSPTSSSSGCSITARSDRSPMLPVAHCTTRYGPSPMRSPFLLSARCVRGV